MAHKGRTYELAFRRDLYLSFDHRSYNTGLAQTYSILYFNLGGQLAGALNGRPQFLLLRDAIAPAVISWQTEKIHFSGHSLFLQLNVGIDHPSGTNTVRTSVWDDVLGELLRVKVLYRITVWAEFIDAPIFGGYEVELTQNPTLLSFNPDSRVNAHATRYSDPQPD